MERRPGAVGVDEMKHLRGIVRIWTRLTHRPSECPAPCASAGGCGPTVSVAEPQRSLNQSTLGPAGALLVLALLGGCGPRAHIPLRSTVLRGILAQADSGAVLARSLAPVLYLQRDESFPLSRVVAVVHPVKRIIAYHLLWRDDVHGSWVPFTVPTDQEIVWIGYDSTGAPVDVWTYWHGVTLHTAWPRAQVAIDVQWGKHGSLPRAIRESDLPGTRSLNFFYAATRFLLPDILLGRLQRKGPTGFPHGYDRYRDFSRVLLISGRLDAVVRTTNPEAVLQAVFGDFSHKPNWPPGI